MGACLSRSLAGVFLTFTILRPGLWQGPDAALSLARSPVRDGTRGISERPLRSLHADFSIHLASLTTIKDMFTSSRSQWGYYPDLFITSKFGRFEIAMGGEQSQLLQSLMFDAENNDLGFDRYQIRAYRLNAELGWWIRDWMIVVGGYDHYVGSFHIQPDSSGEARGFGNGMGGSAGLILAPGNKVQLSMQVHSPARFNLDGDIREGNAEDVVDLHGNLILPLDLTGDIRIGTQTGFETYLTARFNLNNYTDSVRIDADRDSLSYAGLPLFDKNTLGLRAGAGYRLLPGLKLKLDGSYATSPLDDFSEVLWMIPQYLSISSTVTWKKKGFTFSTTLGTERYIPLMTGEGSYIEGQSYFAGLGAGLEF